MSTPPSQMVLGIALFRSGEAPQHSEIRVDHTTTVADVRSHLHQKLGVPPSRQRWLALQQRHAGCQLYMPAGNDNTLAALLLDDSRTLASYGGLRPDLEIHAAAAASTAQGCAPPSAETMAAAVVGAAAPPSVGMMMTIDECGGGGGGSDGCGGFGAGAGAGFFSGFGSGVSGLNSAASVAAAVFEDEFASAPLPPAAPITAAPPMPMTAAAAGLASGASDSCVLSGPLGGGACAYGSGSSYGSSYQGSSSYGGYCHNAATQSATAEFAGLMFSRASAPAAPVAAMATAATLFGLQQGPTPAQTPAAQAPFQQHGNLQRCPPPALFSAFASECAAGTTATAGGGAATAATAVVIGGGGGGGEKDYQWPYGGSAAGAGSGRLLLRSSVSHLVLQPSGSLAPVERLVGDRYESYEDPSGTNSLFLM